MLCQHCQKRIANVHFTQVINSKKVEMYLCEYCAKEKGQFKFGLPADMGDLFSGFLGLGSGMPYISSPVAQEQDTTVCENCGMSYEDFQKTGKVGCSNCYTVHGDRLKPVVKRLHGSVEHTGKTPARISKGLEVSKEVEELKELLSKAVQNEEYEKAAEIRDRIKEVEARRQG